MTTKTLTDRYERYLTIENGRPGIHVHASEDEGSEATVGPFTLEQLRAALDEVAPAGSYTRTDEQAESDPRSNVGLAKHFRDQRDDLEHRLNLAVMASEHNSDRAEKAEEKARGAAREAERRMELLIERTRERDDARADCNAALHREKAEQDRAVKAEEVADARRSEIVRLSQDRNDWEGNALDAEERAEKAEKERDQAGEVRDELLRQVTKAERERDVLAERVRDFTDSIRREQATNDRLRAEQPRPLTPDAITDGMVERLHAALVVSPGWKVGTFYEEHAVLRRALSAALTEPPARPEGAEELDYLVDRSIRGCSDITSPETVRNIANGLAEQGVRAPEAES